MEVVPGLVVGGAQGEENVVRQSTPSFAVRQVKLGPASNGFYPVLDGLKLNDEVVREGSFILKAEAIRQHPEL